MTDRSVLAIVETGRGAYGLGPLLLAKELGFRPVLVTDDLSRYAVSDSSRAVIEDTTHEIVYADTRDSAAVCTALQGYQERGELCGVLAVIDYYVAVVAEVARTFGLPGLAPEAAHAARNKLRTREACARAGVPAPRHAQVLSRDEAVAFARETGFPCVVKPMTEAASIGVRLCRTAEEVAAHYDVLSAAPTDLRGLPRPAGVLVEEYLTGYEVSVEVVTTATGPRVLGLTDKTLGPHPSFVETGETFPSQLPAPLQEAATAVALDALHAIGHDFGASHVEIKMTAEGPKLIEINARMGGAQVGRNIKEATGIDLQREVIRMHTGLDPELSPVAQRASASRYLTALDGGVLSAVDGRELVGRLPGVCDLDIYVQPGDRVQRARSNADVLGHLVVRADTPAEAARWADTALLQLTARVSTDTTSATGGAAGATVRAGAAVRAGASR
ncbi:ATP-grasp domain-containing protein [Streptomyces sp. NBC_01142]|uniref:ATP-grasp domain-containing protein n=1 Tax=Streptomyces sp. NBC_01142 TaxID=2975865 RepID=UPI00225543E1|nr:ATP-grasp domain-containing protein [Streptomyces sp. NBC_01142]MCX4823167.1 ATP-grasp domain-containing protein [Streptomyces sp. NBC_01142]